MFPVDPVMRPIEPPVYSGRHDKAQPISNVLRASASQPAPGVSLLDIADTLDLSPQAQAFLQGQPADSAETEIGFALSEAQLQRINTIILQFRDHSFAPATFDRLQEALAAAGLSPNQLAAQATRPAQAGRIYLAVMNGRDTGLAPNQPQDAARQQASAAAYMRMIFQEWRRRSTQAPL